MIFFFARRFALGLMLACMSLALTHALAQTPAPSPSVRSGTATTFVQPGGLPPPLTAPAASAPTAPTLTSPSKAGAPEPSPDLAAAVRNRRMTPPQAPNQFQKFVQESTGTLLPLFGSEFFSPDAVYAPDVGQPASSDYVLGPGDEVHLQVWGAIEFTGAFVIDRNGQVALPKVGALTLAGVQVRNLEAVLQNHLGRVFTNFQLNANLGRLRSIQVYVVGQALQPGTHKVSSLSTLVNAIFASGGPSANGSMRNIQLKRGGKIISTLDLYDFIAKGDKSRDLALQNGDVIWIPPAGPRVAVTGALDAAAIYELRPGSDSAGDILGLGGALSALTNTRKAVLERIAPELSPPRRVLEISLDTNGLKQTLRDGDVLTLLAISPAFGNAVTLQGTVAAPLRYSWFEGMRILDLIPDSEALITPDYHKRKNQLVQNEELAQQPDEKGSPERTDMPKDSGAREHLSQGVTERVRGLADQINWDYAVIERLDRTKLSTELIPFNLGKAVLQKDPAHNLPLVAGDVVTILSQNDLRLPQDRQRRLVRVEGEVVAPGVYQTLPGETLPQLLQRVGGLTPQAYLFGTEFQRESVRSRQQANLDVLIRRLESQAQAQTSSLVSNARAEGSSQALLIQQQQQAQLNNQINRLKTMQSNGRLALELEPKARDVASLPPLPLENGDHILVPATPGFVSAFGSVNNENVFIYKPGKTVGDVLKTAGLTEDAEVDQAFVLRADGTIVARRDRNSIWSSGFESLEMMPGDTLVVPAQIDRESRYNFITRALRDWTQIFSNFGLGIAAIKSIKSL